MESTEVHGSWWWTGQGGNGRCRTGSSTKVVAGVFVLDGSRGTGGRRGGRWGWVVAGDRADGGVEGGFMSAVVVVVMKVHVMVLHLLRLVLLLGSLDYPQGGDAMLRRAVLY